MYANERSSSIDMGLDYDSTVMLTCKLLFAAAKAIVDVGPYMPRQLYLLDFFLFRTKGGGTGPPCPPPVSASADLGGVRVVQMHPPLAVSNVFLRT